MSGIEPIRLTASLVARNSTTRPTPSVYSIPAAATGTMPIVPDADPGELFRAYVAGAAACRNGTWVTDCPFDRQLVLRLRDPRRWQQLVDAWSAGWAAEHALLTDGPATTGWLARLARAGSGPGPG